MPRCSSLSLSLSHVSKTLISRLTIQVVNPSVHLLFCSSYSVQVHMAPYRSCTKLVYCIYPLRYSVSQSMSLSEALPTTAIDTVSPFSTGIFPHSLPEWAFRARPGLWRICLCPKVARIAEQKFGSR